MEKLNPSRFEIGAVYNARVSSRLRNQSSFLTTSPQPKDKKSLRPGHLQPLKRELVFDIDMTDVRNNDFVPRKAQSPRGVAVKVATIHTLTVQGLFLAVQSKGASLRPVVSEVLHHRKSWTTVRSLVLFPECSPTGLVLREEVLIDPEVMAVMAYPVREWSTARVCRCSSEGF